jgi:electron transfer flavoprotein beta subunit
VAVGREVYEIPLPAVVTVKDGLNIPRYPSVPGRIRAKKKPIEHSTPEKPAPRIEKKKFDQPESTGKQTQFLDGGADAAPALVEVFRQIGVI